MWLVGGAGLMLLGAVLVGLLDPGPSPQEVALVSPRTEAPQRRAPEPAPVLRAPAPDFAADGEAGVPSEPFAEAVTNEAPARHPVDLDELRELLPDNLYWETSVPTKDEEVLRKREEEARRWNVLFGKVQSNTATEEEIHQYFEHRRRVSEDAIAFASTVLERYGAQLPEQEQGLYALSIRMHRTRLDELPRQQEEALDRKRIQDQRREEWRSGRGN